MQLSSFLSLNWQDALKASINAAIAAVLGALYPLLNASRFPTLDELKVIGALALTTFISTLLRRFFTPTPKVVEIDPAKTTIVDKHTDEVISQAPTVKP